VLLDLRILAVDTFRVWWRLLPQLIGIYLVGSGRLCMAALTQETIAPTADAIVQVLGRAPR